MTMAAQREEDRQNTTAKSHKNQVWQGQVRDQEEEGTAGRGDTKMRRCEKGRGERRRVNVSDVGAETGMGTVKLDVAAYQCWCNEQGRPLAVTVAERCHKTATTRGKEWSRWSRGVVAEGEKGGMRRTCWYYPPELQSKISSGHEEKNGNGRMSKDQENERGERKSEESGRVM